ncbi:hypothetical protein SS50377_26153 [Spironucleus salmonicida]|uniref:Ubiquitin-like domain-containing protein n=1 Tax=Spironucleus salmonicida TaxID=348837 RepID=V6LMF4_9EUKA|nr:hypothetical protein SS50377_26153 [Spironucleus salmonicida]|eukprot:EST44886.1 Hypothetical protein SS50377_15177 [Spironucleus salmonicida]
MQNNNDRVQLTLFNIESNQTSEIIIAPEEKLTTALRPFLPQSPQAFRIIYDGAQILLNDTCSSQNIRQGKLIAIKKKIPRKIDLQQVQLLSSKDTSDLIFPVQENTYQQPQEYSNISYNHVDYIINQSPLFTKMREVFPELSQVTNQENFIQDLTTCLQSQQQAQIVCENTKKQISSNDQMNNLFIEMKQGFEEQKRQFQEKCEGFKYKKELSFLLQFVNIDIDILKQLLTKTKGNLVKVIDLVECQEIQEESFQNEEEF